MRPMTPALQSPYSAGCSFDDGHPTGGGASCGETCDTQRVGLPDDHDVRFGSHDCGEISSVRMACDGCEHRS